MAAQGEVLAEVEAVQAVYGTDCVVLNSFPPLLHISIKPRTADVSSEQFVEAIVKIQGSPKYPGEAPSVDLLDCKGLDEQRKKDLVNCIRRKACELSPCSMLVAVCEEAVEKLTAMNHPDGDCPLCLYSLVSEDQQSGKLPFMKLMSCFHCFHRECIIRWWNWLQKAKETDSANSASVTVRPLSQDMQGNKEEGVGNCPVCRKSFHAKDLEHVLDLVGSRLSQLSFDSNEADDDDKLLQSEDELNRRQKFEAVLELQKENGGLIEPKKDLVVLPGMFLQHPIVAPSSTEEPAEQQEKDSQRVASGKHAGGTSNGSSSHGHRNFSARKHKVRSDHHTHRNFGSTVRHARKPVQQWVKKNDAESKQ